MAALFVVAMRSGVAAPVTHASPAPKVDTTTCPELHPTSGMRPVFPGSMIRERREGWVAIGFDVEADGSARNVHVVVSDPGGAFDAEALRAMAGARFSAKRPYKGCQFVLEFRLPN